MSAWDWPLILFFLLAFGIAWGTLGVMTLIAREAGIESGITLVQMGESYQFDGVTLPIPAWALYLLTRLIDFSFSIAGVIMVAMTAGRSGLTQLFARLIRFRFRPVYYVIGLLPLILYGLATILAGSLSSFQINGPLIRAALISLESGLLVSLFLRGALGEELGLRGFALPRLQESGSPYRASWIIGIMWAAWHLPVLLGRDPVSIVAFIFVAIGLSFIFTWLFNGSGGSLVPVLLFHATQNWEEGVELFFPALLRTDWELVSTLALIVLGIVAGFVVRRNEINILEKDKSS